MITRLASLTDKIRCLLFVCFVCFVVTPYAAEFTTPITLSETDTTYDGQDIVIVGTTVTIDGPHSFNSLLLTNNAVLTHLACPATNTHKLEVGVAGTLTVDSTNRIDVSGKGYVPGQTTGSTSLAARRSEAVGLRTLKKDECL